MWSSAAKALLLAGGAASLAAIPASSQDRSRPESLLPPGFGDPKSLPPPDERPAPQPRPPRPQQPEPEAPPANTAEPGPAPVENGVAAEESANVEEVPLTTTALPRPSNYFTVPQGSARATDMVGPLGPGNFGLGAEAFGRTGGPLLRGLMRRLDAPLPSRWASILLRRALLSRVPAPLGLEPVDWVAERASLLLNMGEADAARMLVQAVDIELYTPRMIEAASETALATADPAALCPLVAPARSLSDAQVWTLADGMCAALEGESARAGAIVDQVRDRNGSSIDLQLAEKVIGAGAETRRAIQIDWDGVGRITPWRFGLASATGVAIPAPLMEGAGARFQAWLARAPMVPLEQRLAAASTAASLGVLSSNALVEIYSMALDQTDPAEAADTVGARLRTAWVEQDPGRRMIALRSLWTESESVVERRARLILTAGAAARIPVSDTLAEDAANLIASMLSAGLDAQAARWAPVIEQSGESGRAWAMLALGAPRAAVSLDSGRIQAFVDADDSPGRRRGPMLVAALAGLGRINADQAASAGFRADGEDDWTRAINQAARERAPGTVALLAGIGMQTADWSGVPPLYLYHIVRSLRAVGLEFEARMIAAEAVARL
ncbi:MAG TPA: hypothetical protein VEX35_06325 [Allosphingosinicella sp.]|nr:hypothetical protein [Allosphingosinicella sp.]